MGKEILNIDQLELTVGLFGIHHKVRIPSYVVSRGQISILMGPSGSGKSVFMKTLAGMMVKPEVQIEGSAKMISSDGQMQDLLSMVRGSATVDREEVFYLFQDPRSYLHPRLTIDEHRVLLEHRLPKREGIARLFDDYLETANLVHRRGTPAGQLSGGEAQRLMLGIMSALRPRLILADEPLSAQDRVNHDQLRQLLNAYVEDEKNDCGMILVTHEMRDIYYSIRDESRSVFYVLEQDKENEWSCSQEMPASQVAQVMKGIADKQQTDVGIPKTLRNFLQAGVALGLIGDSVVNQETRIEVESTPILDVKELSFSWGTRHEKGHLLKDIEFIHCSERNIALMGLSGVGKSTLAEIILKLTDSQNGVVTWFGNERLSETEFRSRVQYVFQDCERALAFEDGTLEEVVLLPFKGAMKEQESDLVTAMNKLLSELGLLEKKKNQITQLSGGQQRRAFLARALLVILWNTKPGLPTVLVLDEATVGLDLTTQVELLHLLHHYSKTENPELSLVVISHDPIVLRYICDRFLVIYGEESEDSGATIVEKLNKEQFINGPYKHKHTQRLLEAIY